tara:strand:- start:1268 stop:1663 length:396 start_codon:yes stop_codon:yes gene_type:complete
MDFQVQAALMIDRLTTKANQYTSALFHLSQAQRDIAELKEEREVLEAQLILQAHEDGELNGGNAEKRKLQTIRFLEQRRATTGDYRNIHLDLSSAEESLHNLKVKTEQSAIEFSTIKLQSRLLEGLMRLTE